MVRHVKAKNWAQYRKNIKSWQQNKDMNLRAAQRSGDEVRQQRIMYNKDALEVAHAYQQHLTPTVKSWYAANPMKPQMQNAGYMQRTPEQIAADPQGTEALRQAIVDKINANLEGGQEVKDILVGGGDQEAARKALEEQKAENGQDQPALVGFLETLSSGYMWANHHLTHPFTAAAIAANPDAEAFGDIGKAWDQSSAEDFESLHPKQPGTGKDAISIGQANLANPIWGKVAQLTGLPMMYSGDPNSDDMRDYYGHRGKYENDATGAIASSTLDFAQQSLLDGMTLSMKALKFGAEGLKLGSEAGWIGGKAEQFFGKEAHINVIRNNLEASRVGGQDNAVSRMADQFVAWTGPKGEAKIRSFLKKAGAGDRADVAHIFARTTNREDMDRLLLASMNDPQSLKELRDADTAAFVELSRRSEPGTDLVKYTGSPSGTREPIDLKIIKKPGTDFHMFSRDLVPTSYDTPLVSKPKAIGAGPDGTAWDSPTLGMSSMSNRGNLVPFDQKFVNDPKLVNDYVDSVATRNPELAAQLKNIDADMHTVLGSLQQTTLGGIGTQGLGKKVGAVAMQHRLNSASRWAESEFAFKKGARGTQVLSDDTAARLREEMESGQVGPSLSRYRDSKWAIPINIMRWATREKPTGLVATKGPSKEGAANEIQSALQAPKILQDSRFAAEKNDIMSYAGAAFASDADAAPAVEVIERRIAHLTATEYGKRVAMRANYTPGTPEFDNAVKQFADKQTEVLMAAQKERNATHKQFVEDGFVMDNTGPTPEVIKSPQLLAHLANSVPMIDMRLFEREVEKAARNQENAFRDGLKDAVSAMGRGIASANDSFQSVWRPAVLLRAAYPVRNTLEGYSRVLAFRGLGNVFRDTFEAVGDGFVNRGRGIGRKTGSIRRADARVDGASLDLDHKIDLLTDHRATVQEQIDELARQQSLPFNLQPGKGFDHDAFIDNLMHTDVTAEGMNSPVAHLNGNLSFDLDKHLRDVQALRSAEADVASAQSRLTNAKSKLNRASSNKHIGEGQVEFRLGDGSGVVVNNTFEGKAGGAAKGSAGNQESWDYITGSVGNRRESILRKKMHVVDGRVDYDPLNPKPYADAVYDSANKIFRDSVVTQMQLDPTKNAGDFLDWFWSKAGKREFAAQQRFGRNVTDEDAMTAWFNHGRENLMATFPDEEFRAKLAAGNVTRGDVSRYIQKVGPDNLKPIIGEVMFDAHGATKEGGNLWRRFTSTMFHYIGAVPENTLVREVYYRSRWVEYMDNATSKLDAEVAANDEVMGKIVHEAHRYALRRLRHDIYTIHREKNLPSMIENVSPFWTAQINTATTWPRIFKENPEALSGIARTYTRAREGGFIDDEGYFNPIPGKVLNNEWTGGMNVRIPFTNILSVFAGQTNDAIENLPGGQFASFFAPNAGPQIQMIVSNMQRGTPGFKQLAALLPEGWLDNYVAPYANPMGPSTEFMSLDKFLPTYLRPALAAVQGKGNGTYDFWAAKITQLELEKYALGLRTDQPGVDEINDKTRKLMATMIFGAFTAPGSPRADSPLEPMIQKLRIYQQQHGYIDGGNKFLDVYGDEWSALMTHGGKNQLGFGVEQSKESWKVIQDNPELVQKLAGTDPELVSLLMGAGDGHGSFNKDVRRLMQTTNIPGQDKTMIEMQSPQEIIDSFNVQQGWRQFKQQYSNWKDVKIASWVKKYGSQENIPSERWAELKKQREMVVDSIGRGNETWKNQYNTETGKNRRAVSALRDIVADQKFMAKHGNDPYWQSVKQFVDLHNETADAIKGSMPKYQPTTPAEFFAYNDKKNAKKGYHFSAASQEKYRAKILKQFKTPGTDFNKQWALAKYQKRAEQLAQKNSSFADMYNRWFSGEMYDKNAF